MTRKQLVRKLEARLGNRKLVWFGTRGEDCRALLDLPQFSEVFSLIAPFGSVAMQVDECLETLTGVRVDLDTYDLDKDTSEEAKELRRRLFRSLSEPAVLVPYRPLAFLSSVQYPRAEYVEYLGLFHERQAPFEHKPWVESELRRIGVPVVPWRYYTDEDRHRVAEQIESAGPIVLRTNRSDGGVGLTLVEDPEQLASVWRPQEDGFLAVAPLLRPHIPLNVSACVFPGGNVTLHPPSLQLLGIPSCTNRPFGYCGNDFGAVKEIDRGVLQTLEGVTRTVGHWLAENGYLGAFGIDAMVHEGRVLLAEVNPRFQGSSALSAHIDIDLDRPDVFLSHIAAFAGVSVIATSTLELLARSQPDQAQVICHNRLASPVVRIGDLPANHAVTYSLVPSPEVTVAPEAAAFRAIFSNSITTDGFSLVPHWSSRLSVLFESSFRPAEVAEHWRKLDVRGTADTQSGRSDEPHQNRGGHQGGVLHAFSGCRGIEPAASRPQSP